MLLLAVGPYSLFFKVDRPDDGMTNKPQVAAGALCV
jgi:hypothetical protein